MISRYRSQLEDPSPYVHIHSDFRFLVIGHTSLNCLDIAHIPASQFIQNKLRMKFTKTSHSENYSMTL